MQGKCVIFAGLENARNNLHNCRDWKIQGMENARKEIMGKCKEWKMQGNTTAAATPTCETALCQR